MVRPGGITALVGPNAAGKSTLLRTWMGFERPTSGAAFAAGRDSWDDRAQAVRHIGYVSQSPTLFDQLSIEDHLKMATHLRPGFDPAVSRERLAKLSIPLQAWGGRLSGGQQARVVLSIALGVRPRILLLDEPLAHLDPLARREFLQVVADAVVSEGTTVVLSSHIVGDIERVCSGLIVLGEGRVLLHAAIKDAVTRFSVSTSTTVDNGVAVFTDRDGSPLMLIEHERGARPSALRPASLEEVVLGHLAAGRTGREEVAS